MILVSIFHTVLLATFPKLVFVHLRPSFLQGTTHLQQTIVQTRNEVLPQIDPSRNKCRGKQCHTPNSRHVWNCPTHVRVILMTVRGVMGTGQRRKRPRKRQYGSVAWSTAYDLLSCSGGQQRQTPSHGKHFQEKRR
jgi:hypothetical protein